VVLQLEDRAGNKTSGITLQPDHISNTMGGRIQSAWYAFNETSTGTLSIDPAAGLTKLGFTVNGKLEDQGGVGFAIQDGALLSSTSCLTSFNPIKGRFDVAVSTLCHSWAYPLTTKQHRFATGSTRRVFSSNKM
jgi:hypothetical protein